MDEQRKPRTFAAIQEKVIASQRQKIEEQEKQIKDLADVVAQQKLSLSQMQEETKVQEEKVQKWRETMLAEPGTAGYYKILHDRTKNVVARMSEIMIDQSKAMEKFLGRDQEFWQAHADFYEKLLV